MASITTRTTELEAVNTMLSTIGEAPVNSLTGSLPTPVSCLNAFMSSVCLLKNKVPLVSSKPFLKPAWENGWHGNPANKILKFGIVFYFLPQIT